MADDKRLDIDIDVRKTGTGDTDAAAALGQVKDAASQAKQSLEGLDQPILQGVAKSAPEAASEIAKAGDAAEVAGGLFENANPNLSRFREALVGISQISNGDTGGQLMGFGRVIESLGKAVGAPGAQLAILAGAIGLVVTFAKELSAWADSGGQKVSIALGDIAGASAETKAELEELAKVDPTPEGLIAGLAKLSKAYAEIRKEAEDARRQMLMVAQAKADLAKAELGLEKQQAISGAGSDKERADLSTVYDYKLAMLQTQTEENDKKEEAANLEGQLRDLGEEQNRLLAARQVLVDDLLKKTADEESASNTLFDVGPGFRFDNKPPETSARERGWAADAVAEFDATSIKSDPESGFLGLEGISAKMDEVAAQLQVVRTKLVTIQTTAEAIDTEKGPAVEQALQGLDQFMRDAETEINNAVIAGEGLQEALDKKKDLEKRVDKAQVDRYVRPDDGSSVIPAERLAPTSSTPADAPIAAPNQPEVVSVLPDSIQGLGSGIEDAAVQAASTVDAARTKVSGSLGEMGNAATTAATDADVKLKAAGEKVTSDLSAGANVIEKTAQEFASGAAGGVRDMTASMKSMSTEIVAVLQELIQDIAITRLEARQAMAASRTALAQIENMG